MSKLVVRSSKLFRRVRPLRPLLGEPCRERFEHRQALKGDLAIFAFSPFIIWGEKGENC